MPHGTPARAPVNTREVRDELVLQWRFLPRHVAARMRLSRLEPDDAEQAGFLGMLRAAELFERGRGLSFATYAYPWVRQAIQRADDEAAPIRVPNYLTHQRHDGRRHRHREAAARVAVVFSLSGPAPRRGHDTEPAAPEATGPDPGDLEALAAALAGLTEDDRAILRERFELGRTLAQCGDRRGITKEGARHQQNVALGKLRRLLAGGEYGGR